MGKKKKAIIARDKKRMLLGELRSEPAKRHKSLSLGDKRTAVAGVIGARIDNAPTHRGTRTLPVRPPPVPVPQSDQAAGPSNTGPVAQGTRSSVARLRAMFGS